MCGNLRFQNKFNIQTVNFDMNGGNNPSTAKWNMPIQNWNEAMAHFLIKFEGRV
jgi:transposase-like protein